MTGRVTNMNAFLYVKERKPFKGSNLYGANTESGYAVWSYGPHFPLYYWDGINNTWYGNEDRYSMTTSRHKNQAMPCSPSFIKWVGTDKMRDLVDYGVAGYVVNMLTRKAA